MPNVRVLSPEKGLGGDADEVTDVEAFDAVAPPKEKITPPPSPSQKPTAEPTFVHTCTVNIPALDPSSIELTLDTTGQHTLSWTTDLTLKDQGSDVLPAGSCNLYLTPGVKLASNGEAFAPTAGAFGALKALMAGLFVDASCPFATIPDAVGAFPIHAITVANTDGALEISEACFTANPKLLLSQLHTNHRAGFPLFFGESSLHICCVNRREGLLLKMLELMAASLTKEESLTLLSSQATGVFFNEMPMRHYGGTVLAYACCFDLRDAVKVRRYTPPLCGSSHHPRGHVACLPHHPSLGDSCQVMLDSGLVGLNDRDGACAISGFLPIHAVVANSLEGTYDWMTTELPPAQRADPNERSSIGRVRANTHSLTTVQLGAKLGDHVCSTHLPISPHLVRATVLVHPPPLFPRSSTPPTAAARDRISDGPR